MRGDTNLQLLPAGDEANPPDIGERQKALISACKQGYHQDLDRLVNEVKASDSEMELLDRMLLLQLTARHQDDVDPRVDRVRCLQQLLNCGLPVGVNKQDKDGNTLLHLAALHEDQSMVAPLIEHGAIIGIQNIFGTMPMDHIKPKTMEAMLDRSVSRDADPNNPDKFVINFQYNCLLPPASWETLPAASETANLFFVSQSWRHQGRLHHPVLSSFLTVKWLKIQPLYLLAVALYAAFVAILTGYVYLEFDVVPDSGEVHLSARAFDGRLVAMEVALWVVLLVLILRELLELAMIQIPVPSCSSWRFWRYLSPWSSWRIWRYMFDFENILQDVLILLLAVMLIGTVSELTRLHIAVWAILLAWLDFFLLLGRHPWLSTYIMMFKTVSETFIKFILLYSLLIVSFSIAFNLLFRSDEHFKTFWRALLKTAVMSTGEMEYNSLEYTHFAYMGHIALFAFLFLIVLVLMNLLNGLAVSDTAKIRADAKLNSMIARVSLIHYTEAAVLGFGGARGGGCCGGRTAATCLDNVRHWLAYRVLKWPRCTEDRLSGGSPARRMTLEPSVDHSRLFCCKSHTFSVDKKVVEAAQALLAHREHVPDDPMERKLDALMKMVQEMKGSQNV